MSRKKIELNMPVVVKLYESESATEIGRILGVSRHVVTARLREAGVRPKTVVEGAQLPCIKCGSSERYKPRPGRRIGQCKACNEKHRVENRERIKKQRAKHYIKNREVALTRVVEWRLNNRDWVRAYQARWYIDNREKVLGQRAEYRLENLDVIKTRNAEYKRANPGKIRACNAQRRAKKREAMGSITESEWAAVVEYYGGVCLKCGEAEVTMDHIIPLSCGGEHTVDNVQPLCRSCNSSKGVKVIDYRAGNE